VSSSLIISRRQGHHHLHTWTAAGNVGDNLILHVVAMGQARAMGVCRQLLLLRDDLFPANLSFCRQRGLRKITNFQRPGVPELFWTTENRLKSWSSVNLSLAAALPSFQFRMLQRSWTMNLLPSPTDMSTGLFFVSLWVWKTAEKTFNLRSNLSSRLNARRD
jgi:hypothetical protein